MAILSCQVVSQFDVAVARGCYLAKEPVTPLIVLDGVGIPDAVVVGTGGVSPRARVVALGVVSYRRSRRCSWARPRRGSWCCTPSTASSAWRTSYCRENSIGRETCSAS